MQAMNCAGSETLKRPDKIKCVTHSR